MASALPFASCGLLRALPLPACGMSSSLSCEPHWSPVGTPGSAWEMEQMGGVGWEPTGLCCPPWRMGCAQWGKWGWGWRPSWLRCGDLVANAAVLPSISLVSWKGWRSLPTLPLQKGHFPGLSGGGAHCCPSVAFPDGCLGP